MATPMRTAIAITRRFHAARIARYHEPSATSPDVSSTTLGPMTRKARIFSIGGKAGDYSSTPGAGRAASERARFTPETVKVIAAALSGTCLVMPATRAAAASVP